MPAEQMVIDNIQDENVEIEHDQYLVYSIDGQEFGIQAMRVQEIATIVPVTRVPNTPPHIEGIMNLRGRLASVLNFRKMFGFGSHPNDEDTRIVIVEYDAFPIGVIVDAVEEVIRIQDDAVQKLPEATSKSIAEEFIRGVGMLDKRIIILLNIDKILGKSELMNTDLIKKAMEDVKNGTITPQLQDEAANIPAADIEAKTVQRSDK
jgi:purine-binding chemotaxis protein CheW